MTGKRVLTLLAMLLTASSMAGADTVMTFTPDPADLSGLDHYSVYMWGIDVPLAPGELIDAAELRFNNIRNWDDNSNDLYVHQLDWTALGVTEEYDNQAGGDYFATVHPGEHTHLVTYHDLPSVAQDLTYTFTGDDLAVLNGYLADGRIGVGLDPDCHFFNDGIAFTVSVVPEPASLALLAVGGLAILKR